MKNGTKKKGLRVCAASMSAVLIAAALPFTSLAAPESGNGWEEVDGKYYWYEDGVLQGYNPNDTSYRGKEIWDPETDAWYWLDNDNGGAKAVSKDVYQESEAGQWGDILSDGVRYGKWVRYDENGAMVKGWDNTDAGTYYFDLTYGTMAKGYATIDGVEYYFNTGSGTLERELGKVPEGYGWKTIDGADYWYEDGIRQGYSVDSSYRGKEIYDPDSDAWYWLDNVDGGRKAVSKDVYQESDAGDWAENEDGTGKWVRYDENGHMIKGWSTNENGTYYFDPIYGTMAKGIVTIDGVTYKFDSETGICVGEIDDGKTDDGDAEETDDGEERARNIEWSVSYDGRLTVTGECGSDGLLWDGQGNGSLADNPAPWREERANITSAYVNVKGAKSLARLFKDCTNLKKVDLSDLDTSSVTDMSCMFYNCNSLITLDLSSFDTSNVTDMSYMFYMSKKYSPLMYSNSSRLRSIDLRSFDTSSVTDMRGMFYLCDCLTRLDLSNFDTSSVTDMSYMFYGCNSLTSLDLSSFDTSSVTDMQGMFFMSDYYGHLTSLDLSSFDTSSVTNMQGMFSGCNRLTSLDLSSFDTSNVTNMQGMFYFCSSLTGVDMSNFNTSCVTDMANMFGNCKGLTSLDLSSFDTSSVTDMRYMFLECRNLESIYVGSGWTTEQADTNDMFRYTNVSGVTYVA